MHCAITYDRRLANKTLSVLNMTSEALGMRFQSALSDKYISVLFDNADTGYAEVREGYCIYEISPLKIFQIRLQMAQTLYELMGTQWRPGYRTVDALVHACQNERDPLKIR